MLGNIAGPVAVMHWVQDFNQCLCRPMSKYDLPGCLGMLPKFDCHIRNVFLDKITEIHELREAWSYDIVCSIDGKAKSENLKQEGNTPALSLYNDKRCNLCRALQFVVLVPKHHTKMKFS